MKLSKPEYNVTDDNDRVIGWISYFEPKGEYSFRCHYEIKIGIPLFSSELKEIIGMLDELNSEEIK